MALSSTQLSALSRLFSPGVIREMAVQGRSPLFARLLAEAQLFPPGSLSNQTVSSAFEAAFTLLRKSGARDEYVYRAALTHNILLGRHSLRTASMLTEFRAGSCKADLVILNGTSTVYEIKSDRDTLSRLANQIANYRKVFAKIYIIAGAGHIDDVLRWTSAEIGVMSLVRWNRISIVREAAERPDLVSPTTILDSLRVSEATMILESLGVQVPSLPNTKIRSFLTECFASLDPGSVHAAMVSTLKRSRNLSSLGELIDQLPISLQAAALSTQLRHVDHERLVRVTKASLSDAITWA